MPRLVCAAFAFNDWTPPNIPYTTVLPALHFVSREESSLHYATTAEVQNFDSTTRVTLVITNARTNAQVISYAYMAVVR